jgi:hypothetical protein
LPIFSPLWKWIVKRLWLYFLFESSLSSASLTQPNTTNCCKESAAHRVARCPCTRTHLGNDQLKLVFLELEKNLPYGQYIQNVSEFGGLSVRVWRLGPGSPDAQQYHTCATLRIRIMDNEQKKIYYAEFKCLLVLQSSWLIKQKTRKKYTYLWCMCMHLIIKCLPLFSDCLCWHYKRFLYIRIHYKRFRCCWIWRYRRFLYIRIHYRSFRICLIWHYGRFLYIRIHYRRFRICWIWHYRRFHYIRIHYRRFRISTFVSL